MKTKRFIFLSSLIFLLLLGGLTTNQSTEAQGCAAPNWDGRFYSNTTLNGNPAVSTCNTTIDFSWGNGSPVFGIHFDNFSVRWTSTQTFPTAGTYIFTVTVEDGARLFINGVPIIDSMVDSVGVRTLSASYDVATAGQSLAMTLDMVNFIGNAQIKLDWTLSGTTTVTTGGGHDWTVEYFNNLTWSGTPVVTVTAPSNGIARNYNRELPAPGVLVDGWSSRWTRTINLPAGTYTFYLRADDGAKVRIDGNEIMNQAVFVDGLTLTTSVALSAGTHTISVEHHDVVDRADLFLTWTPAIGTNFLPDGCNGETAGFNGSAPPCTSVATTTTNAPTTVTINTAILNFRPAPSLETIPLKTIAITTTSIT